MNTYSSSAIIARQNITNYKIIIFAIVILLIALIVYFLVKQIQNYHLSDKWLEKNQNQPTTKSNITHVAKEAELTVEEKNLLEQMCKEYQIPNIQYHIKEDSFIDSMFKQKYNALIEKNDNENTITILFSLRYKIEKVFNRTMIITSTKSISEGQVFSYKDPSGMTLTITLLENNSHGLVFEIPETLNNEKKPEVLSKMLLNFTSKNEITYYLDLRVIRYDQSTEGKTTVLLGHSNSLQAMQRRTTKRMSTNKECKFSAVEVKQNTSKNISKENNVIYKPMENKYDGLIQNISAAGCRLNCPMPIKQGQYIYIEFCIDGKKTESVIGLIIMTTQTNNQSGYILHIQFVKITQAVRNSIYAVIYNYI